MRLAMASTLASLGWVFGLLPYETAILVGVAVSIGLGIINFIRLGIQATEIRKIQEGQEARIEHLPPPPLEG